MFKAKHLALAALLALGGGLSADDDQYAMGPEDGPPPHEGMHEGHGGPGKRGGGPMQMLKKLGLSKEQKDKLKGLQKARRGKMQELQNKAEDAREALEDLLEVADKSKAHEDKLRAKQAELAKLQAEKMSQHFESLLEIRSVLTDDQLKKFIAMKEEQEEKREKMREHWKGKWGKGGKGKPGHDAKDHDDHDDKEGEKDDD